MEEENLNKIEVTKMKVSEFRELLEELRKRKVMFEIERTPDGKVYLLI